MNKPDFPEQEDQPAEARNPADLLVVDDTVANLRLLVTILDRAGHHVRPVSDGSLALGAARKQRPDLVLLDVNMPGMDGFEVCEQLKADPDLRDVPVVFISALSDTLDKVRAFKCGGVDYITKPFDREEVLARVATHLHLARLKQRVQRQNENLREANRELQRRAEYESYLSQLIVHDLRAPLSGVMGYMELLQINSAGQLDDEFREDIDKALGVASQMSEVIDSLLDVSRNDREDLPLQPQRVSIAEIALDALASIESVLEYRHLETRLPDRDVEVTCDPVMMRRAIVNLLHNALKFTTLNGFVEITIDVDGGHCRVTVADDGPGLDPQVREKIFSRFGLGDLSGRNHGPLPGLGLAFCKLCVEAHGGEIGVEDRDGGGSRFWFTFPTH